MTLNTYSVTPIVFALFHIGSVHSCHATFEIPLLKIDSLTRHCSAVVCLRAYCLVRATPAPRYMQYNYSIWLLVQVFSIPSTEGVSSIAVAESDRRHVFKRLTSGGGHGGNKMSDAIEIFRGRYQGVTIKNNFESSKQCTCTANKAKERVFSLC